MTATFDYGAALRYLYSLTDLEKSPGVVYTPSRFNLERMGRLVSALGHPESAFAAVHVAGTKGKGSTAAMIASVLRAAGHKTGLYTSPHLHTFRERITVDGIPIAQADMAALVSELEPTVSSMGDDQPSTFEVATALAFLHFSRQGVELAVLEVGLGGRLDATNVVTSLVSVITSLSLDHTAVLGDTLTLIAREKAGIIKPGGIVVSSPQPAEALKVIHEVCEQKGARLYLVGREWRWQGTSSDVTGQSFTCESRLAWPPEATGKDSLVEPRTYHDLWIPLLGEHQLINACTALAAVEALRFHGILIASEAIEEGLRQVRWPGRLQVLSRGPTVVVDGAHNRESAALLLRSLQQLFRYRDLYLILGTSRDKDIPGIVGELAPAGRAIIVTHSRHPRAADPEVIAVEARRYCSRVSVSPDVATALAAAKAMAKTQDLICVAGSLFLVAEAIQAVTGVEGESY